MVASDQGNRSGYIVVTADRALADACKAHRVNVIPPESLLRQCRTRSIRQPQADDYFGKREEKGWVGHTRKKGSSRRAPKNQRKSKKLW